MVAAALMALLAACGDDEGGSGGAGGAGGTGPGNGNSLGFDPCADVFTHDEIEALVGNDVEAVEANDYRFHVMCDWKAADITQGATLSVTVYRSFSAEDYQRTKEALGGRDLSGLGDQAFYGFGETFGVAQGSLVVRKGNRGLFALISGWSNTEASSETILRAVAERYLEKL